MKVAKVRYVGRKSEHTVRTPDGEQYHFRRRDRSDPWTRIGSVEHANHFEDRRNYEVTWSARGRVAAQGRRILDLGYQTKRSIASDLDLSFEGQPGQEELDQELEEYIKTMENERGP